MELEGTEYHGKYEAIISTQTYDLAQEVKNRVRVSPRRPKTLFFPYCGFIHCAECGCVLTTTKKKGRYDYYYCTNGKGFCSQHKNYLTEKKTTDLVAQVLTNTQFDVETIEIMYEAARQKLQNDQRDIDALKAGLITEIEQITRQERKLLQTYTSELIDETLYREEVKRLKKEKVGFEATLAQFGQSTEEKLTTLELTKKVFLDCNQMVFEFSSASPERKREITQTLLWNFAVQDEKVLKINYKRPYEIIALAPKMGHFRTLLVVSSQNHLIPCLV